MWLNFKPAGRASRLPPVLRWMRVGIIPSAWTADSKAVLFISNRNGDVVLFSNSLLARTLRNRSFTLRKHEGLAQRVLEPGRLLDSLHDAIRKMRDPALRQTNSCGFRQREDLRSWC